MKLVKKAQILVDLQNLKYCFFKYQSIVMKFVNINSLDYGS